MKEKFTLKEFKAAYSTDAACLDKIWHVRFGFLEDCPNCYRPLTYRRITTRRAYQCRFCYHQLYPTADTIFAKTTTPLTYWFYAIFLMTTTRNGVAAKELQRVLGVTYKCAFRMGHKIRELMNDNSAQLLGYVELDHSYIGGLETNKHRDKREKGKQGGSGKEVIFGMVERLGNVKAFKVANTKIHNFLPLVAEHINKDAVVSTDEFPAFKRISGMGYNHGTVNHKKEEYRKLHICTNSIEGYFSQVKRTIYGTHIHVSGKYLQQYVNECSFRYNHRTQPTLMFEKILENLPSA